MNIQNLSERVKEYISLRHEGENWDFKRQWYDNDDRGKADLLHNIICMANTIEDEDGLIIIDGKMMDVVIVKNSTNVPFYLNERCKKIEAYHIYTRVGDSNIPVDKSADRDRIEALWKKRFGIGKDALQKFRIYLKDVNGWESIDGQ